MADWFGVTVPDEVTVPDFFLEKLPKILATAREALVFMREIEFAMETVVDGVPYGVTLTPEKVDVVQDTLDAPIIRLEVNEATWREHVTGKINMLDARNLSQATNPQSIPTLRALQGRLTAVLTREDGPDIEAVIVFNGKPDPESTMRLTLEDFRDLNSGAINGPMLFMQGRMALEGDIGLVMKLQSLLEL